MSKSIQYPLLFDDYFKQNQIVIKQIPDKYRIVGQTVLPDKIIKNTKTFIDYINREFEFWDYNEISRNSIVSSYKTNYFKAKQDVEKALSLFEENPTQALEILKKTIQLITTNCQISSVSQLGKLLKLFKDKNSYFFQGFDHALVPSNTAFAISVVSALVGRGFLIIESSICVAVITFLPAL